MPGWVNTSISNHRAGSGKVRCNVTHLEILRGDRRDLGVCRGTDVHIFVWKNTPKTTKGL